MRVLIVTELWPPHGGSFVFEQVKAIAPYVSVTVAVLIPNPPDLSRYRSRWSRFADKSAAPEMEDGIPVYYLRYRTIPELGKYLNSVQAFRALACFLRQRKDQFDLIHAHFAYTTGFAAVRAGRSFDLPVIVATYGSDINFYTKRTPKNFAAALFTIWGLRHAAAITALSKDLATKISALGISHQQITVISLGIRETIFSPRGEKLMLRRQLQLPTAGPLFLFVGNWVPVKGLKYLFDAFARVCQHLQQTKLMMIGSGELEPVLKQQAQTLGIVNKIIWIGQKAHAEIPLWMSAADFLVLPSLSEGYGLVVLEALACGTPVIASRAGGIPEILTSDDFGILVPPRDSEALARAMLEAAGRKWAMKKLVDYAHAHTWSKQTQDLLKLYQNVMQQRA
ncbi:MAG: glycosyltransferase family 4 protein [candidate division KSB1 bacterium]|nr:glycosyltransferase family 4 protein [candidate division KSB1 bacterium]MDZ7368463.1 glycosyltransferase family 4 protein [candidate division KSB1 bacterium]MDZ7406189.1 glycosyltransferase family 4 protein [candidate division KSB1 bacterium]